MDAAAGGLAFVDMAAPVPCFKMVEHAHSDAEGIVLVVCAIKEEAVHILAACDNVRHVDATPLFPWRYALGTVTGADSVRVRLKIVVCDIGIANAAAATTAVLATSADHISFVVNCGCCGSHLDQCLPGDVVIGTHTTFLDARKILDDATIAQKGFRLTLQSEHLLSLPCDPELVEMTKHLDMQGRLPAWPVSTGSTARPPTIHCGVVGSSDTWTKHVSTIRSMAARNQTACEDMEAAAVALVCAKWRVPFICVKDVFNNELLENAMPPQETPATSFGHLVGEVGRRSALCVLALIQKWAYQHCTPAPVVVETSPSSFVGLEMIELEDRHALLQNTEEAVGQFSQDFSRRMKLLTWCYESSVGAWPLGATLGLGITIFGTSLTSLGMYSISELAYKYDESGLVNEYLSYYILASILFIGTHSAVFLHGLSTGILKWQHRCCQKRSASMNCACCEQGRHCACFCRGLEKCAQRGCQVLWALLGTALLFVIYIVGLVLMVASTVTSALSWGLHNSCRIFSGVIDSYIVAVKHYIALAKASLARGDSTMAEVLQQYQDWQNIQTQFSNSGVATLATVVPVHTQSTIDAPKPIVFGRRLSGVPPGRMLFDPEHEIKNGRSIISTLNETIFQSEAQIIYYEEQVGVVEGYCVDFGALYTAFLYILVAAFCLLISELIMFAVHTKYFSSWKYEVLLMEQEEAAERKMSLVLKSRPDTPSGQGEKVLD